MAQSMERPPIGGENRENRFLSRSQSCIGPSDREKLDRNSSFGSSHSTSCCPPHGAKAVCGRRSKMEDKYVIRPDFLQGVEVGDVEPKVPAALPSKHSEQLSFTTGERSDDSGDTECSQGSTSSQGSRDAYHLFAVYDGHGGVEAAKHCSERMHSNLLQAWSEEHLSGATMDEDACFTSCESASSTGSGRVTSGAVEKAFRKSFKQTDDEFIMDDTSALVGSTAVVSLVGHRHIFVGNCGDSRAVLCRNGQAHPLTADHKPERLDETERVQDAGGQVLFYNGARVMGLLAMTRAIGDRSLRPYVISDPEVTVVPRLSEDELLILASDGLWDVVSNQEACTLAMRCLQRAREKGACQATAARLTATVLTRAAMDRGSRDNVTVVVVDLRSSDAPTTGSLRASYTGSEGALPTGVIPTAVSEPVPERTENLQQPQQNVEEHTDARCKEDFNDTTLHHPPLPYQADIQVQQ